MPCRLGTKRMLEILERITAGHGRQGDIETLEALAVNIKKTSLCGLGQTAPNPVLTTIKYFRDEYEAHIGEHRCPALSCDALIAYVVDAEACTGCMLCAKRCPTAAARGEKKQAHAIEQELCIRCDACRTACKFDAVKIVSGPEADRRRRRGAGSALSARHGISGAPRPGVMSDSVRCGIADCRILQGACPP